MSSKRKYSRCVKFNFLFNMHGRKIQYINNAYRKSLTSEVVKIVAVERTLQRTHPHCHHVLIFGR